MQDIKEVLIALQSEGLEVGAAWQQAHELAQQHEGQARYDLLHAALHRIEGDELNAAYWYRRAGEQAFEGDIAEEIAHLIERLG